MRAQYIVMREIDLGFLSRSHPFVNQSLSFDITDTSVCSVDEKSVGEYM